MGGSPAKPKLLGDVTIPGFTGLIAGSALAILGAWGLALDEDVPLAGPNIAVGLIGATVGALVLSARAGEDAPESAGLRSVAPVPMTDAEGTPLVGLGALATF